MSLLSPFKLNLSQLSQNKKFYKHLKTESPTIGTQRTLKTQRSTFRTQQAQSSRHNKQIPKTQRSAYESQRQDEIKRKLKFTTKKKFLSTNYQNSDKNKKNKKELSRHQISLNHRMYRSVEQLPKKQIEHNPESQFKDFTQQIHIQSKQNAQNCTSSNINFPIQFKNSSGKNKFHNTSIRSYGVSTYKSDSHLINNHILLINLGLIKQFYIIQCIDGQQTGLLFKKNISFILLRQYFAQMQRIDKETVRNNFLQEKYTIPFPNHNITHNKQLQRKFSCLITAIHKAFKQINRLIYQKQLQTHDNSGCFVTGVLVLQNILLSINCGLGTTILYSTQKNIIQSAQPHSTLNNEQIRRVIGHGALMYRTQFNVPYKQNLSIKGPIRLHPSGSEFTRIVGKTFTKIQQIKHKHRHHEQYFYFRDPKNQFTKNNYSQLMDQFQQKIGLISKPQIKFIQANQIQFFIIATSQLIKFMEMTLMCSIVLEELKKYSLTFTVHDLAGQCSRQILNQAYLRGFKQNSSVIVVFLNIELNFTYNIKAYHQAIKNENHSKKYVLKKKEQQEQTQRKFKSPLKYIGYKKSFCKYQIS